MLSTVIELSTWAIVILVLIFFRFIPRELVGDDMFLVMTGAILGFALIYYLIIRRFFNRTQQLYIKTIGDIILIGILLHFARDYNNILYSLYFLPILSASLALNLANNLVIVTVACLMIGFEILLNYNYGDSSGGAYGSFWQIFFLVVISLFARFLAVQLQKEKEAKEEMRLEKKIMIKASHRLQNPLSIIRNYASSLEEGDLGAMTKKQKEYVETIHEKTIQMIKIVSNMIKLNKREEEQINKISNR